MSDNQNVTTNPAPVKLTLVQLPLSFFNPASNLALGQPVIQINAGWTGIITRIYTADGKPMVEAYDTSVGFTRRTAVINVTPAGRRALATGASRE